MKQLELILADGSQLSEEGLTQLYQVLSTAKHVPPYWPGLALLALASTGKISAPEEQANNRKGFSQLAWHIDLWY